MNIHYECLSMNDWDGKSVKSKVITAVINKGDKKIKVYPTIFDNFIMVNTEGVVEIVNAVGQVVLFERNYVVNAPINVQSLASGVYVVRVRVGQIVYTEKIVKP